MYKLSAITAGWPHNSSIFRCKFERITSEQALFPLFSQQNASLLCFLRKNVILIEFIEHIAEAGVHFRDGVVEAADDTPCTDRLCLRPLRELDTVKGIFGAGHAWL